MSDSKTVPVKIYLSPDAFLAIQAKCDEFGISMSSAGNLAFRQWQPAHSTRRQGAPDRPKPGLKRALALPGHREGRGGAPTPRLLV